MGADTSPSIHAASLGDHSFTLSSNLTRGNGNSGNGGNGDVGRPVKLQDNLKTQIYFSRRFPYLIEDETNGRHFADDIFKRINLDENVWIPIKISLQFVPKGPINNIPALVQIMAWCRPDD